MLMIIAGCSNSEKESKKLYIQATELYDDGKQDEAIAMLNKILEDYPDTDTAVSIVNGDLGVGGKSLAYWKRYYKYMKAQLDINQLKIALDMFCADTGQYPTSTQGLEALLNKPYHIPDDKWNGPYLDDTDFLEPWGNIYVYTSPGTHEGYEYDLYSYGEDGIKDNDDITNWIEK